MELTNRINNEHMVDGLNQVLRATIKAKYHCDRLIEARKVINPELSVLIEKISATHSGHLPLLSDAILFLGGDPATSYSPSGLSKFSRACFSVRHLRREEIRLIELCDTQIHYLTGSDESVEKLNIVKDDVLAGLDNLARFKDSTK